MPDVRFPSTKARVVLAALLRQGWSIARQKGSHRTLKRGAERFTWPHADGEELGEAILKRIAKRTGLTPEDL